MTVSSLYKSMIFLFSFKLYVAVKSLLFRIKLVLFFPQKFTFCSTNFGYVCEVGFEYNTYCDSLSDGHAEQSFQ